MIIIYGLISIGSGLIVLLGFYLIIKRIRTTNTNYNKTYNWNGRVDWDVEHNNVNEKLKNGNNND